MINNFNLENVMSAAVRTTLRYAITSVVLTYLGLCMGRGFFPPTEMFLVSVTGFENAVGCTLSLALMFAWLYGFYARRDIVRARLLCAITLLSILIGLVIRVGDIELPRVSIGVAWLVRILVLTIICAVVTPRRIYAVAAPIVLYVVVAVMVAPLETNILDTCLAIGMALPANLLWTRKDSWIKAKRSSTAPTTAP